MLFISQPYPSIKENSAFPAFTLESGYLYCQSGLKLACLLSPFRPWSKFQTVEKGKLTCVPALIRTILSMLLIKADSLARTSTTDTSSYKYLDMTYGCTQLTFRTAVFVKEGLLKYHQKWPYRPEIQFLL